MILRYLKNFSWQSEYMLAFTWWKKYSVATDYWDAGKRNSELAAKHPIKYDNLY